MWKSTIGVIMQKYCSQCSCYSAGEHACEVRASAPSEVRVSAPSASVFTIHAEPQDNSLLSQLCSDSTAWCHRLTACLSSHSFWEGMPWRAAGCNRSCGLRRSCFNPRYDLTLGWDLIYVMFCSHVIILPDQPDHLLDSLYFHPFLPRICICAGN